MNPFHKLFLVVCSVLTFASAPALAAEPHGDSHGTEHAADSHGDGHGEGHAEGGHGDGHGEHHYYTDDDDGDGVPNWRDGDNGTFDTPETYVVSDLIFHAINLSILLGLIGYAIRRPVGDFFRDRARQIRGELTDSARQRDEANQRHQELLARLKKIEGEVDEMSNQARQAAAHEEESLNERAEREAARIGELAQRSIRDETTRARNVLRKEAVELAVKLAEDTLRSNVASEDQRTLATDFLESLQQGA